MTIGIRLFQWYLYQLQNLGELQTAYNDATDIDEADRDAVESYWWNPVTNLLIS